MKSFVIRNIINPFVRPYFKGSKRYKYLKELRKAEKKSIDENTLTQRKKLYGLIKHAYENVPYYKRIIEENKINYSEQTIFKDIKKFPVLTKQIIRENFNELQDTNLIKKAWKNTSGGSTGEPVIFYQNKKMNDYGAAESIQYYHWAGRREGEYMIKLWGDEREILKDAKGIDWFLIRHLKNIEILNSFKMSKKNMMNYINIINKRKPKIIDSYVQSMHELAKFIKENKLKIHSPKGIITSAGTLYPEMKKLIEEVFQCKVYNRYGSREAGDMACTCEKDEGLHVNIINHYFEILDEDLKDTKPKKFGKVYITTLNNYVMPLIRYDIGDIAVPKKPNEQQCSCRRGFPLIEKIEGRETSMFKTKKGTLIPGEFFIHFVGVVFNKQFVSKIQIIQKKHDLIIIIKVIVKNMMMLEKYKGKIENSIKKVMGEDCMITWEFVKKIPSLKSGKYLYAVSEIK